MAQRIKWPLVDSIRWNKSDDRNVINLTYFYAKCLKNGFHEKSGSNIFLTYKHRKETVMCFKARISSIWLFLGSPRGKLMRKKILSELWRLRQKNFRCSFALMFMIWNCPSNEVISYSKLNLVFVKKVQIVFMFYTMLFSWTIYVL